MATVNDNRELFYEIRDTIAGLGGPVIREARELMSKIKANPTGEHRG